MIKKELYAAPETEVLELKLEGNVLQVTSLNDETNPVLGNSGLDGDWE